MKSRTEGLSLPKPKDPFRDSPRSRVNTWSPLGLDMRNKRPEPPNLAFARNELKALQQILGLLPTEGLDPGLQDAVFVCIDVEAYENAQNKITEIGVAILDTKDIKGISPDDGGNWFAKMKHAHYRPVEHASLVNRRFVKGCEEHFNYGATTFINLADAGKVLNRVFSNPSEIDQAADLDIKLTGRARNVIFVAHGLRGDRNFLKDVGFVVSDVSNTTRIFDTQRVAGSTKQLPVGLQRLLLSLGLEPVNLHNAGNDAAYTLQSLILMAVKDHEYPGTVFSMLEGMPKRLPPVVHTQTRAPHAWACSTATASGSSMSDTACSTAYAGGDIDNRPLHPLSTANVLPQEPDLHQTKDLNDMRSAATASCGPVSKRPRPEEF